MCNAMSVFNLWKTPLQTPAATFFAEIPLQFPSRSIRSRINSFYDIIKSAFNAGFILVFFVCDNYVRFLDNSFAISAFYNFRSCKTEHSYNCYVTIRLRILLFYPLNEYFEYLDFGHYSHKCSENSQYSDN